MIQCVNCGHVNQKGASQCEACFEAIPDLMLCSICQTSVPNDALYCPQCGASLSQTSTESPDAPLPEVLQPPEMLRSPRVSSAPPTDIVVPSSPEASPLPPPTDIVRSPAAENLPVTPRAEEFPETMPPTDVVFGSVPEADSPVEDLSTPEFEASRRPQNKSETAPTMVVSPNAELDVVDVPLPVPPSEPPQGLSVTVPPQAPPSYQPVDRPEETVERLETNTPVPNEISAANLHEAVAPSSTETLYELDLADIKVADSLPPETTVQPEVADVGYTVLQKPPARLLHERTDTSLMLPPNLDVVLLGKATSALKPDVDVSGFVDSDVVSRRHAAIFVDPKGYFIEDLGSSNGTYVNDSTCAQGERVPIKPGDRICLGRENKVSFIFHIGI
ncbi:MAG: FHA domain-containing protein [Cyanobacteria bacterium P01_F01_bin.42]